WYSPPPGRAALSGHGRRSRGPGRRLRWYVQEFPGWRVHRGERVHWPPARRARVRPRRGSSRPETLRAVPAAWARKSNRRWRGGRHRRTGRGRHRRRPCWSPTSGPRSGSAACRAPCLAESTARDLSVAFLEIGQQMNMFAILSGRFLECRAMGLVECAGDRQVDGQRIHRFVVDPELVVQMRAGGPSGGADIADELPLPDAIAFLQPVLEAALMRIKRADAIMVLQDDGVAIAILPAAEIDDAVRCGMDGSAAGRGVVDAFVPAPSAMHRVLAHAERGADAGELQRRAQKRPLQAAAFEVVVAAAFAIGGEPDGLVSLAAIDEFQCQDAAGADVASFVRIGFVDDAEMVP